MTRRKVFAVVRAGLYVAVLGFLGYQLFTHRGDVIGVVTSLGWGRFAAAVAIAAAGAWLGMAGWRALLTAFGCRLATPVAAKVYFVAGLGRYLPGGLWPAVAHADLARKLREPPGLLASAFLASVLVSTVAGLAVGLVAVPALAAVQPVWWVVVPVFAGGLLVIGAPQLTRLAAAIVRRRTGKTVTLPGPRAVFGALGLMAAGWLLAGLHLVVLTQGLPAGGLPGAAVLAGGFALASVAGVLVVVLPAGLGAREAVLGLALNAALAGPPTSAVVAVVAMSRLVVTAADLLAAGVSAFVRLSPASPGVAPSAAD
ncbi:MULTISPECIES: hypothetical protein [unclassified Amycolatopsis]|uniref:hypothetical protein n=1 Tax=unclassified Amycolatopsis TaxID=2618356 RepID=UPI0028745B90|nr:MULTISPECIES: hypothetical protein [unclassified Amycolatopsis]MDS0136676.1 flippase-like domain-containing protein [Amycolatopsis sp. 505]MDS0143340.1 flippase-like domain-containing protein [Amycolatopsis sp. CM201R]